MVDIGCVARFFNVYEEEVKFSITNGFKLMQLWYDKDGIALKKDDNPIEEIKRLNFPTIIHAVLDINEFEEHVPKLIDILHYLSHDELIIHPVCKSEKVTNMSIVKLSHKISFAYQQLSSQNIKLYIENNSMLDLIFNSIMDIEYVFNENPEVELILDIAHIDSYEHLKGIVDIKTPRLLHVADRHLEIVHEHLPIGEGNIDFNYIFKDILEDFDGRIILEIVQSSKDIIESRDKIALLCGI